MLEERIQELEKRVNEIENKITIDPNFIAENLSDYIGQIQSIRV